MKEKLQGLLALTWSVLTRLFREGRLKRLTAEHMEVLSGIVLHHLLVGLSERDSSVLARKFCEFNQAEQKALIRLTQAAQLDLVKTMYDIEYSDKEQS